MNIKTTVILLVLAVLGGCVWLGYDLLQPGLPTSETLDVLKNQLIPDQVSRIDVADGTRHLILERSSDGEWTLPGKWPTRKQEVEQLVGLLTGLRSRFAPEALSDRPDLAKVLAQQPVKVTVHAGDKDYLLHFGEGPEESNRFSRPTFLRLDDKAEVIRMAPGIVAALNRPPDYYRQRRLFLSERIKQGEGPEKSEVLAAKSVAVKGPDADYTLSKTGKDWDILKPRRDRADPDKLKTLLAAVPDIWVEYFVENPKKDLAEYGLKNPNKIIVVGDKITLLIGKQSPRDEARLVLRPAPPGSPGMPQLPPQEETIHEKFRYAKLQGNDQIFEIKEARLKDIFVSFSSLRDARLARFSSADARRVEISQAAQEIVLEKDKAERWRLQKPMQAEADSSKISDLLDKLSGLEARGEDVIDKAQADFYGLAKPAATVRVQVQETTGEGEHKTKKPPKTFTFELGKDDVAKSKLYVRMAGWSRINAVDDSLLKLVQRPALAYRSRRIFDFFADDVAKIKVQHGAEAFVLEHVKNNWQLAVPVHADADSTKATQLADDLGRLEAVEYVSAAPKKEELDQQYGLAKPALSATVTFSKKDKPPQTLLVGKQRGDKAEYFAKIASDPAVFVVKKDIDTTLEKNSLAYRPLQLWKIKPEDVAEIKLQKDGQESLLKREGAGWKILEPFQAETMSSQVQQLLTQAADLRADRYEAHLAKAASTYGLDKPFLRLVLQSQNSVPKKETNKNEKPKKSDRKSTTEHVLLIGKQTATGAKSRFARLGNSEAIVVLGEKFIAAVDHNALDLLDRNLLSLDTKSIVRVQITLKGDLLTLEREGKTDKWRVNSPAARFQAAPAAIASFLTLWSNVQADRFAKYGSKVNAKEFGLDKPLATIKVFMQATAAKGKSKNQHSLVLGKAVEANGNERYARLDDGPAVFVLGNSAVRDLTRTYLDFADRTVLKLDGKQIAAVQRRIGRETLEMAKGQDGWRLTRPFACPADEPTVDALLENLSNLQGDRVAAYQARDLKPFGLDAPAAVLTLRLAGAKPAQHVVKIGKIVASAKGKANGARYVRADDALVVAVISAETARQLLAPPLHFRDHNLAHLSDADQAVLERGPRKAVFSKVDDIWKMTSPLETDADQTGLEDFTNALAKLRADDLVADRPKPMSADLKPFGLDKPEVHWQFQSEGKNVLDLWIGAPEKIKAGGKETSGPRRYAKLGNQDLVFLLDAGLTTKVMGEYRSRTVWSSLDAAQIDSVSFGWPGHAFLLEKVGSSWQVAGKPDFKVKAEAVTETLDALARLQAQRYVEDKDTNLKLYGLEPPQLVLSIHTSSGQRTLRVGRAEGASHRFYAHVPGGDRPGVFVIAAAQAKAIVRDLPAFKQSSPPGKAHSQQRQNKH